MSLVPRRRLSVGTIGGGPLCGAGHLLGLGGSACASFGVGAQFGCAGAGTGLVGLTLAAGNDGRAGMGDWWLALSY
ncbi:MAG: hypothetical protein SVR81_11160 [Chloroflexota bacterium]|nr:hypothetical protein [Chloroflexota bacterium]